MTAFGSKSTSLEKDINIKKTNTILWNKIFHYMPYTTYFIEHSYSNNGFLKKNLILKVVERLLRSQPFTIAFVLGLKHGRVPNLIKTSQKLLRVGWTQENKTNRATHKFRITHYIIIKCGWECVVTYIPTNLTCLCVRLNTRIKNGHPGRQT